ncbi:MAG: porin family protein [Bacteroidota bacterium]
MIISCAQFPTVSWAQSFTPALRAGITAGQISGDGAYGFVQFGGVAGGSVTYNWNADWSVRFGIRANQKGARIYKTKNSINTYRLRVNYIETPLSLKYAHKSFRFSVAPVFGVKINQRERTQYGDIEDPRTFDTFEWSAQFGVEYIFKAPWSIQLSYQNSLVPVRAHKINQAYPPANFVLGEFHQKLLNKGQYFSSLSLALVYTF